MLKKIILITIASLFSTFGFAKFEIQTSYPFAVVTAAYTWSDVGMNSRTLLEILNQQIKVPEELRAEMKTSLNQLPKICTGKDERNDCRNSRETLVQMALESKDLNELSKKMMNVWSLNQAVQLTKALQAFSPQYEKEIWLKNQKEFQIQIKVMNQIAEKMKADEFLNHMKTFYGSNWPEWLPNTVGVYPVPTKRGHTSGSSYGHFAEQAILLNEKAAPGVLAISFHEMAHGYYRFQNKETKTQWSSFISKYPLKDRYIFDALLNEGLATILGNGVSYKLMTDTMDEDQWYNDLYIEAFARANFELIQKRFIEKSPLTSADFDAMLSNFKNSSKDWDTNPQFYAKTFTTYFSKQHNKDEAIQYLRQKHMAHSVYHFQKYEPMLKKMFDEQATFFVFLKPGEQIPTQVAKLLPMKIKPSQKPAIKRIENKERWLTVVWYNDVNDLKTLFP